MFRRATSLKITVLVQPEMDIRLDRVRGYGRASTQAIVHEWAVLATGPSSLFAVVQRQSPGMCPQVGKTGTQILPCPQLGMMLAITGCWLCCVRVGVAEKSCVPFSFLFVCCNKARGAADNDKFMKELEGKHNAILQSYPAVRASLTPWAGWTIVELGYRANPSARMAMAKSQFDSFHKSLLALRERIRGDVQALHDEALPQGDSGNLSSMPIHLADMGTDAFEQEFTLGLLHNEEQVLEQIEEALGRIEEGTFGTCEECQTTIPRERLEALPYTAYCVDCSRKLER